MTDINARYKLRRGTDAEIQAATLEDYEMVYAYDTDKIYIYNSVDKTEIEARLVVQVTAGEALSEGDCVYADSVSGEFLKADAETSIVTADACGIVVQSGGIDEDATGAIQVKPGVVVNSGWSWTPLQALYLSTSGAMTQDTEDVAGYAYTKQVGVAITATQIVWFPETGWSNTDVVSGLSPDQFTLSYVPTNYTRTSTPEVTDTDQLSAHLAGIDAGIGGALTTTQLGAASGVASLNASTKVVENPANATATPTESKIPIADGSGKLNGWVTSNTTVVLTEFDESTSTPATLLDPPDDAVILKVVIVVSEASTAGSPTVSVGISGTVERDMAASATTLSTLGVYSVSPYTACGEAGANIILSITPDSQTFTGRCYLHYAVCS